MSWTKDETICKEENCWKPVRHKGWCNAHYLEFYKSDPSYKPNKDNVYRRNHPLYWTWWERKNNNLLCEDWLKFDNFVNDVNSISPKPEGKNYSLIKLNKNEPLGPNNFKWQEFLFKKENESNKEWWARKRAARLIANPSMDRDRNLKKFYGITKEQYEEMRLKQNGLCAICGEEETATTPKNGSIKKLAIDHCHASNKIRELLCWRCNTTLGKLDDNIELLDKMKAYLIKHRGSENG